LDYINTSFPEKQVFPFVSGEKSEKKIQRLSNLSVCIRTSVDIPFLTHPTGKMYNETKSAGVNILGSTQNNDIRWRRGIFLLFIASLLCCLVIISGLNRPHLSPLTNRLEAKYPVSAAYNEHGIAVLDNQQKRILILSPDRKLNAIVDATKAGSPVDKFSSVTMYGDRLYAMGVTTIDGGIYLSSESIVEYDLRGNVLRTVYSETYPEDALINNTRFAHTAVCGDQISLLIKEGCDLSVLTLDGEIKETGRWTLPEPVYSAGYSPYYNVCMATGLSKTSYDIDCRSGMVKQFTLTDYLNTLRTIFHVDLEGIDTSVFEDCFWIPSLVVNEDGIEQYYSIASPNGNLIAVISPGSFVQYSLAEIHYSTAFLLKNLSYWIALAFVAAEAVLVLVWLLLKKLNLKSKMFIAVVGAVILTSVFYTVQIRNASNEVVTDALKSQTKQMSFVLSNDYGDFLKSVREEGVMSCCYKPESQARIGPLRQMLKTLCDANGTSNPCFAVCYIYDEDGQLYLLTDNAGLSLSGQPVILSAEAQSALDASDHNVITVERAEETLLYDYGYICSSDGEIAGVLVLSLLRGSLRYLQSRTAVEMSVTLLALMVGIYVAISALRSFYTDLKRRSTRDVTDGLGRSMDLMQLYSFLGSLLFSLDSVVMIYVARSLCADTVTNHAILIALPVAALSLGQLIGRPAAVFGSRLIGERAAALFASVMIIVSMLVCFFAVRFNSIYIYTAGKLALGFSIPGMMYVLVDGLPYHSRDEGIRKAAINSMIEGEIAATILSALAGGYISHYLSYGAIYLLGTVLAVLFLVLSAGIFAHLGKNAKDTARNVKRRGKPLETWTVFLRGPMLMYLLFYVFPGILIDGYSTYLFPMFSAGAGISALLLSKLSVFVRAFTYLMTGSVKRFSEKMDPNVIMVAPLFVICFGFLCFYISPNIYWAIIMLFVYEVMALMTITSDRLYLVRKIESYELDVKRVLPHYYTIESALHIFQSPVLSAAVPLGMNLACTVVGAACGVLYTIFALFNRNNTGAEYKR